MPTKKPGFTLEKHDELGRELQEMRDKLTGFITEVGKCYNKDTYSLVDRSIQTIDMLRSKMDDHICREQHGNSAVDPTKYYYRRNREN